MSLDSNQKPSRFCVELSLAFLHLLLPGYLLPLEPNLTLTVSTKSISLHFVASNRRAPFSVQSGQPIRQGQSIHK